MIDIHQASQPAAPGTCDRCIARAAFLAVLRGGGELLFCGHHHGAHRERLLAGGAIVWPLPGRVTLDALDDAA